MSNALLQPKLRLGDLLVSRGFMTPEQLDEALAKQSKNKEGKLLGEIIIDEELCPEDKVLECVAVEFGVPYVKLDNRMFDPKVFDSLPREFIEKNAVLPLFKVRDVLTVAVAEPTNVFLLDQLRDLAQCTVQISLSSAKEIRRMVQTYMPDTGVFVIDDIIDDASEDAVELIEESIEDIGFDGAADAAGLSPIIKLVNYIIFNGVKDGASDIHIEPTERQLRVRYRVDGVLHKAIEPPVHLAPAVASRIKIMADLDISERRLPQDGRIHVMMEGRPIDLRISTLPGTFGEKVVIRILDNRSINLSLQQLGFSAENHENFDQQILAPNGIALVTGQTGSGKSTTLAAIINRINERDAKHIITLEDPIEFQYAHGRSLIEQREIGADCPSFASGLKHVLRQDSDVILVGELRDLDTIRTALQAAETGHLVLSTLHSSSAAGAIDRIVEVFPADEQAQIRSHLAECLRAIVTQRLLPSASGHGRVAAIELLLVTLGIQTNIRDGTAHLIPGMMSMNRRMGMQTMEQALKELVLNGRADPEDVDEHLQELATAAS